MVRLGPPLAVPLPVRGTVAPAPPVKVSVPFEEPAAVGANRTVSVISAFAARE
jgi:hypothetical protein